MAMHVSVFPLEVRTTSVTSSPITVWEKFNAAHFVVTHPNVGGGLTVSVSGKDPLSGSTYTLLSSSIVASGITVMKIGPDYTAGANVAKDYIPYQTVVTVTASGTNAYSIGASYIQEINMIGLVIVIVVVVLLMKACGLLD